jgi:OmcA/MtrC family decaheme c-type cytochrome
MNRSTINMKRSAALTAVVALSLTAAATRHQYSPREKAAYADSATVDFVRPGLAITINQAQIASDGTITVVYTLADPKGLPLDAAGVTTPGAISLNYITAVLPNNQQDYATYTTRSISGAAGTFNEPNSDSGGVTTGGPGQYQYVFHTKAPAGFDATATHTIGIFGSRVLTDFNLGTNYASTTYNFVPNGASVTKVHDVIRTASCNTCHDQLSFHGGARRGVEMCVLCHNPGMVDTVSGGSVDFKVMIHELHMGEKLPTVVAGKPLLVAGTDFSKIAYPADPGDPRRCETCHSQTTGAAQATAYLTNPTAAACGACHNDVNFATGANHPGGPQIDDKQCANCHIPQGEIDFDASIKGAHVAPTASSLLTGLAVNIVKVDKGTAGNAPVVSFTVQDASAKPLALSQLGSISFTMAGPTTDYGYTSFGSDTASTPGYVTESAAKATCDTSGNCTYTFTHQVPAKAVGTYAIGVEARRTETLLPGTTKQQSVTYGTPNKVVYFSVDGSPVTPRREVVANTNCNQCHVALSIHGSLRNNTEYCVMCHNPSNTDASVRVNATVPADKAAPPQGITFPLLVHRIHDGVNMLADGGSYTVVGFGGSHNDFSGTLFPAMGPNGKATDLANCSICHLKGSEANLPVGLNNVVNPQGWINPEGATATACSGCHVAKDAAAHFAANTSSLGESCTVCHQTGAMFDVNKMHAQY